MIVATSATVDNFADWRSKAREFLRAGLPPQSVQWTTSGHTQQPLFESSQPAAARSGNPSLTIPKAFLNLAETVSRHSDPCRWQILYRVAWRILYGERHLLEIDVDDDIAALHSMRKGVERDIYKMRAFVRFRKVESENGEDFVAWYQPEHRTLDANGKFFVDRFGSMRWAILTPEASMMWNLQELQFGPGVPRSLAPQEDTLEDLWRLYYSTIYNPARLNLTAMRAQLPVFRWVDLPEARVIPELVRASRGAVQEMADKQRLSSTNWIPETRSLPMLRQALGKCRACSLCARATQAVWGEGNPDSDIMLVGEQPGDEEDRSGRPFIGPAGKVLDEALEKSGWLRSDLYITNAVKAFRFEERGKRRIHQTPRATDMETCRPWLLAEMDAVRPKIVMCLGSTAAQSVLGRKVQIKTERGKMQVMGAGGTRVGVTYHPSAVLRMPDEPARREMMSALIADLAALKTAV